MEFETVAIQIGPRGNAVWIGSADDADHLENENGYTKWITSPLGSLRERLQRHHHGRDYVANLKIGLCAKDWFMFMAPTSEDIHVVDHVK